jgi:hypothetical protein
MFYRTVRVRTRDAVRVVGGYAEIICCVRQEVRGGIRVRNTATTLSAETRFRYFFISTVSTHKRHVYRIYIFIAAGRRNRRKRINVENPL